VKFSLNDSSDHRVCLENEKGKVVLLTLGYTHCADACPSTPARLAQMRRLLEKDAEAVQVIFVTIDPDRDAGPFLQRYMRAFDPSFVGLHGLDNETDAAATSFHADYRIGKFENEVLAEHTVDSYLVDGNGHMRVVLPHLHSAQQVVDGVRAVFADQADCTPRADSGLSS